MNDRFNQPRHLKRNRIITTLLLAGAAMATSCNNPSTEAKTNTEATTETAEIPNPALIIDLNSLKGKDIGAVEKILGKAEDIVKVKGYPCKLTTCQKATFKNGAYEVFFKLNKLDRIVVNNIPDLTGDDNALASLGLTSSAPSFKNPGNVIRWQGVEGIHEIDFFPDYLLIQITKPE